jgi:hypothetical protein
MSKMDAMRAMREARYEAAQAGATKATPKAGAAKPTVKAAAAPKTPRQAAKRAAKAEVASDPAPDGLCGHRAISGRTCTREKGHAAKSHRYS